MANRKKMVGKRRATFLEVLAKTCNVTIAARAAGITRQQCYKCRTADEGLAQDWDAAVAEALDMMESEVVRRAFQGVDKPIMYKGIEIKTVKEYSDQLAMFYLNGRRPEIFKARFDGNLSTADPDGMVLRVTIDPPRDPK